MEMEAGAYWNQIKFECLSHGHYCYLDLRHLVKHGGAVPCPRTLPPHQIDAVACMYCNEAFLGGERGWRRLRFAS